MKPIFLQCITFFIIITTTFDTSHANFQLPTNSNSIQTHNNQEYIALLAGVLSFLAAAISSAGGIGGGGLFIPILTILAALDLKTATAYSAFMVTGGSIANVGCHIFGKRRGLIDYDIALLSEPLMLLGVSCGVICNRVFPEWMIMVFFGVFLGFCTFRTCNSGVLFWKMETQGLIMMRMQNNGEEEGFDESTKEPLMVMEERIDEGNIGIPWMKIGMLLAIWFSFLVFYLLRGNRSGQGIIQIKPCGTAYWIISATQVPIAIMFTALILYGRRKCPKTNNDPTQQENESRIKCDSSHKLIFPAMALLAGVLGGVFGIGGGMLISPLLLQIGIAPQVTAATCSFMVLFSSTMSAIQYLLLGMENIHGALIYASICFAGSLVGLTLVQKAINKHGRASLIVFSVGTVMALSTVMITSFGAMDVWTDYTSGKSMGFKRPC